MAGKRIDLVVEDSQQRIAVECDGDERHGPDEYEADCLREGIISRCGWHFARIRASNFYAQRVKAIDKLIGEITLHGVRPWNPSGADATYSALDRRDIRGADSLIWLGESRTAGSIKYQTGMRETDWPEIEDKLLRRNLVRKTGSRRRPRFELIAR